MQVPDAGAGEGVPLQPLSDAQEADRDRACAVPHREADQDLVPEQEDEVEEGEQNKVRRGGSWLGRVTRVAVKQFKRPRITESDNFEGF